MIPMVDDFLQMFIVEKLTWLKKHPKVLDHIFFTGQRSTLEKLRKFIEDRKIKVVIGYPKDQTSLPAYVITLAPEQEQPSGLGDNYGSWEDLGGMGIEEEDDSEVEESVKRELSTYLADTFMNGTYRIECWSDNGDLTAYMYIILKWCLWSSRNQMFELGSVNPTLSGTDLEPVPDYMPVFIYRRAAQLTVIYDNLYYENIDEIGKYFDVLDNPDDYKEDDDGNIVGPDDEIIIPGKYKWVLTAHYYMKSFGDKGGEESEPYYSHTTTFPPESEQEDVKPE